MVTVRVCSKLKTNKVGKNSRYFVGVFNNLKAINPLALVGYEMITANSVLRASLATTISYPTCTRGIIVNYLSVQISQVIFCFCFVFFRMLMYTNEVETKEK